MNFALLLTFLVLCSFTGTQHSHFGFYSRSHSKVIIDSYKILATFSCLHNFFIFLEWILHSFTKGNYFKFIRKHNRVITKHIGKLLPSPYLNLIY
jgi:hypothetical protein